MRNETTDRYEADPASCSRSPTSSRVAVDEGTFHLGGDEATAGVDPGREGYPAGQAVGAIDALMPAGEIVIAMVHDAEAILGRLGSGA